MVKPSQLVSVLIPVYKEVLSEMELKSLHQCISILSGYPLTLVCPRTLNIKFYLTEYKDFKIEVFDDLFFSDLQTYNKLLISYNFYSRFRYYKYILIYHLDAWVFKDDLKNWCEKDYDYIGAPWFKGWHKAEYDSEFIGIGNGGFSLRKVKSHMKYTSHPFLWIRRNELYNGLHKGGYRDLVKVIPRMAMRFFKNNLLVVKHSFEFNEDGYWTRVVGANFIDFKIPDYETAAHFSFEYNCERLFEVTGHTLPFGCHKWEYNLHFWHRYILTEPA